MATVGYDDTREVYPECVFLVANSWGRWNEPPKVWPEDRYGPWPEGSFWLAEDVYEQHFVGSRSIFTYCDIKGVPQKKLPDYGNPQDAARWLKAQLRDLRMPPAWPPGSDQSRPV